MRIIQFITRGDEYYGAQKHVNILSKSLKENGHCVLVVVGSHGELTKKLEIDKIDFKILTALTRSINLLNDFKAFIQYKEILKFVKVF